MKSDGGPMGGPHSIVEADETFVGGKAKNRAHRAPKKMQAVFALVERDTLGGNGRVQSYHVANVTGATLRPLITQKVDRASYLMTDEAPVYKRIGKEFADHGTTNHQALQFTDRVGFKHTNTVENFFSIFKRGIVGVYHHVSQAHLSRYTAEFDFRYNTKGTTDAERTVEALKGIVGKRLTYRRTGLLAA
jgi:transposase-like protein